MDHKMVVMTICLSQFAQGMGYYRCPNILLQDDIFKKVLKTKVEESIWKHTKYPMLTKKAQEQEHNTEATDLFMEIINRIREVTALYSRRKHQAVTGDKQALRDGKKLVTQELDTMPLGDRAVEAELEWMVTTGEISRPKTGLLEAKLMEIAS